MYRFILTLALLLLVSCSKEEITNNGEGNNQEEESKALIFSEDYVSIDWEQAKLTGYDEQTGMVELTYKDPSAMPNLTEGKVFAALSEDRSICSIRLVKSAQKEGNTIKMATENGCLGDVFEDAHFTLMIGNATPQSDVNVFYPTEYIETNPATGKNTVSRAGTGIECTVINPKVEIKTGFTLKDEKGRGSLSVYPQGIFEAELSFGAEFNFRPNLDDAIDKFYRKKLGRAKFYTSGKASLTLNAGITGTGNLFSTSEKGKVVTPNCLKNPLKVMFYLGVPPTVVPVLFGVNADLVRDFSAGVSGSISANIGVKTQASITCGAEYRQDENKVTSIPPQLEIETTPSFIPQISTSLNGKIEWCFYPRIKTELYNFVGPILDVKPYTGTSLNFSPSNKIHGKDVSNTMQLTLYAGIEVGTKLHFNMIDRWIPDIELFKSARLQRNIFKIPGTIKAYTNARTQPGESLFMVYDSICDEKTIQPTSTAMDLLIYDSNKKEYIVGHTDKDGIVHFPYSSNDDKDNFLTATIYNGDGKPIDSAEQTISQAVYIPDAEFRKCLYYNGLAEPYYDASGLVKINSRDKEADLHILSGEEEYNAKEIASLEGIEYFLNDKHPLNLYIGAATKVKKLNLKGTNGLKEVYMENANMSELDLSGANTIKGVSLNNCTISSINLSNINSLESCYTDNVNGEKLNLSECPMLSAILISNISNTNLNHCISLKDVQVRDQDNIESVNLTNCTALNSLVIGNCKSLKSVKLTGCMSLSHISISQCKNLHTTIPNECSNLNEIYIRECDKISNLNCSNMKQLEIIDIRACPITTLNLNGCTDLKEIYIGNELESPSENTSQLSSLDFSSCNQLYYIHISDNQTPLIVNVGTNYDLHSLHITNSHLKSISLESCPKLRVIDLPNNDLTQFTIPNQDLTWLKLLNNPIKQVLPDYFENIKIEHCYLKWRYTNYKYDENNVLHYTDHGTGWWYSYEPKRPGSHW